MKKAYFSLFKENSSKSQIFDKEIRINVPENWAYIAFLMKTP